MHNAARAGERNGFTTRQDAALAVRARFSHERWRVEEEDFIDSVSFSTACIGSLIHNGGEGK